MPYSLTTPEGFISLGHFAFKPEDIDTPVLEARKAELNGAMNELDFKDRWTQQDWAWRNYAKDNITRIEHELKKRAAQ